MEFNITDPNHKTPRDFFPRFEARTERVSCERCWPKVKVDVVQINEDGEQILGSYERNYSGAPFFAFKHGDRWFALYSYEYTATALMEIFPGQGFKELYAEAPASNGFCPVSFFVPQYQCYFNLEQEKQFVAEWQSIINAGGKGDWTVEEATKRRDWALKDIETVNKYRSKCDVALYNDTPTDESGYLYFPPKYGFVSGCVWGDDGSWKVQIIDLDIENGKFTRSERMGYIPLYGDIKNIGSNDRPGIVEVDSPDDDPWFVVPCELYINAKTGEADGIRINEAKPPM